MITSHLNKKYSNINTLIKLVMVGAFLFFGVTKAFSQSLNIVSDCVTVHDLEVSGIDLTGRHVFDNAPMLVAWDNVNFRWSITYLGTNQWYSNVASSPNPPSNPADWYNAIGGCSAISQISISVDEVCNNGLDDDGDGLVDCLDSDCQVSTFGFDYEPADFVAGQNTFTTSSSGLTTSKYNGISDIAVDPISKKVFVSDTWNHRVLRYASVEELMNNSPAESVLGQVDFTSSVQGSGMTGMARPMGICVDSHGSLWVACFNNSRVLRFDNAADKPIGGAADGVLGKPDFIEGGTTSGASGMANPIEVLVDDIGTLWVSDYTNRRVLRFDNARLKSNGASANGVLGKPDFNQVSGVIGRNITGSPVGLTLIGNSLFVADTNGDRIVRWDDAKNKPNGADSDIVLGQPNFDTEHSGTTSISLHDPYFIDSDSEGKLYVSDSENHRVLVFNDGMGVEFFQPADFVYGQPSFNNGNPGTQQNEINQPRGVSILDVGYAKVMAVSDHNNNRMIGWGAYRITGELSTYNTILPAYNPNNANISFSMDNVTLGNAVMQNASIGSIVYIPPGMCPLNRDSILQINYTITNEFSCTTSTNASIKVKDVKACISNPIVGSCNELYPMDWFDGGSNGLQWPITNGGAILNSGVVVSGVLGDLTIDVTLDNQNGQNIDFANCGSDNVHLYTATCNDPNASQNCDGDPFTVDSQNNLGCEFLTMGMTPNNSDDELKLTFDFDKPVKINDLTIIDIDYDGSTFPSGSSWQDEIKVIAYNGLEPVKIFVIAGTAIEVIDNASTNVSIKSIYDPNGSGILGPNAVEGHASIATLGFVTSISLFLSNGPDDDGLSDDNLIGISSFNVCPQFEENTVIDCSDGLDNDMDGFFDCNDTDCNGLSACPDFDGDGISDAFDKDDDNDGLSDVQESVDNIDWGYFGYGHNTPTGTMTMDNSSEDMLAWFATNISDEMVSGLTVTSPTSSLRVSGVTSNNFEEAYANDKYLGYSFTTADGLINPKLNSLSCGLYSGIPGDSYHVSMLISMDGFATYTIMSSAVFITSNVGAYVDFNLNNNTTYWLESNTTYEIRMYPYSKIDDSPFNYVSWDDFSISISAERGGDFDLDNHYDHLDLDSDNDGIHDVIEAGGTDNDNDGEIGVGGILDYNGNGWSSICDPSDGGIALQDNNTDGVANPDRLTIDSDADGCNDVNEAGYPDSNNDGILGGVPLATDAKGKVIYIP